MIPMVTRFERVIGLSNGRIFIPKESTGTIVSWGEDNYNHVSATPTESGFIAIASDTWLGTSLALRSDGSIVSWPFVDWENEDGCIGSVPTGSGFKAISASSSHNLALAADGSIEAWGWDGSHGVISKTPTGNGFVAISVGGHFGLAIQGPPPGDLNSDGEINISDLNMVLIDWGKSPDDINDLRADSNGDGKVDIVDLNTILIDWGK